jgi:P2 family phage contractile tail tube protein
MNAPVEVDMGMEKLECDFTLQEYSEEIIKLYGLFDHAAVPVRFKGVLVADDGTGTVTPVEVAVRGRFREIDPGTWKAGEAAQLKVAVACSYYKYSAAGADLIEIDVVNMVEKVNGVDRLAAIRAAIGG